MKYFIFIICLPITLPIIVLGVLYRIAYAAFLYGYALADLSLSNMYGGSK